MARAQWMALMSVAAAAYACGPNILVKRGGGDGGDGGSGGSTVASSSSSGAQGPASSSSSSSSSGSGGSTCMPTVVQAEGLPGKVDLVLLAEATFSTPNLYDQIEVQLHPAMVAPLEQAGVDVQVIVVADYGPQQQQLCFGPPLSPTNNCNGPPGSVAGKFHHYDANMGFGQMLCNALSSLHGTLPDSWGQAPNGWYSWLRADATKALLGVTGTNANCTYNNQTISGFSNPQQAAVTFDQLLMSLGPAQFGTSASRNYSFSSLLNIQAKNGVQPYPPTDPIANLTCSGFGNQIGPTYQWLSIGTEALRASQCANLPNQFAAIASALTEQSRDPCVFDIPDGLNDPTQTIVTHYPGGGQAPVILSLVPTQACTGASDELYVDGDLFKLCPATCDAVEQSADDTIEIEFGCPTP